MAHDNDKYRPNLSELEIINIGPEHGLPSIEWPEPPDPGGSDTVEPEPLPTPTNLRVKSQRLEQSDDGTQVVDVVIEFDEVPGANTYQVRFSKVD